MDTMFRAYFKKPENFLQLLARCRDGKSTLTTNERYVFNL